MNKDSVSVVIDFKIYAYSFEPIIKYLQASGVKVFLFLPDDLKKEVADILPACDLLEFCNLTEIKSRHRIRFALHRACSLLFTRTDFSFQFKKKREQSTKKWGGVSGLLLRVSKFTPKIPNKMINRFLALVSGVGLKNPFPTSRILVGSLNASAELLGARGQQVITVMESWDHAVKEPNGYCSSLFFGWNKDLCEDWMRLQGDLNCKVFHPLKLRYAHEEFQYNKLCLAREGKKTRVLYPVAGTAKFSIGIMVKIEKQLIQELIDVTGKLGLELYIKPRPNGMEGEFRYAAEYDHVEVGEVSHGEIKNPANYYYSEDDNFRRFEPLRDIDLVINAFTTFGLDSAVAGLPVLQLDLREAIGFESSSMIYNNYHIKNYLINSENIIKPENITLSEFMLERQSEFLVVATRYSKELNDWLYNYESSSEAIDACFSELLNLPKVVDVK